MFPTKEEALEIARTQIGSEITVFRVTDEQTDFRNFYGSPPPGCWYIIYGLKRELLVLESSSYIAISKVDGREIDRGCLNDEG